MGIGFDKFLNSVGSAVEGVAVACGESTAARTGQVVGSGCRSQRGRVGAEFGGAVHRLATVATVLATLTGEPHPLAR